LQDAGEAIEARFGVAVAHCEYADGAWHARDAAGAPLGQAPVVVFANALDAMRLAPPLVQAMQPVRGQVTYLPPASLPTLAACVLGRAYLLPAADGRIVCGATYQPGENDLPPGAADHADNLRRCAAILATGLPPLDPGALAGRAGLRAVARDRLPLIGALGQDAWCATGFGSRGILWGRLAGEVIAAQLEGEPLALEKALLRTIDPLRFTRKG
jgi:tRNA 5-methylaminomethyl-2-thiouridine biosynthesis bifunctional protein